ncbi:DUF397 domain-containing protein [Streptomyces sp. NPDC050804]|uniref:DUF397 domain-containing protein n=1 Tax=Streptomyces sp. NPDC050804 TaxID=3154745 RepID=UPI00344450CE
MTVSRIPKASVLTGWRKSSYSGPDNGDCVEVADGVPGIVPVRDSKNPDGPALAVPAPAWSSFIGALTEGALNTK